MPKRKKLTPLESLPGVRSLYRRKRKQPISITMTERHHAMALATCRRLKVSRSDLFAVLLEQYATTVTLPDRAE